MPQQSSTGVFAHAFTLLYDGGQQPRPGMRNSVSDTIIMAAQVIQNLPDVKPRLLKLSMPKHPVQSRDAESPDGVRHGRP